MEVSTIAAFVLGVIIGAALIYAALRSRTKAAVSEALAPVSIQLAAAQERASRVEGLENSVNALDEEKVRLSADVARLTADLESAQIQSASNVRLLLEAKETLSDQFKTLANEILEDKSKRFTEQNQANLDALLTPLKEKITEFQTKVENIHVSDTGDRSALKEQVRQLMELNQTLSEDAKNLTRALTGSSKTQGNWGEFILESILEKSGLRNGDEYEVRESYNREDGTRAIPDVIVKLPQERHLVVDAKVSLTAYAEFDAIEDDESERQAALKRHLKSVRSHVVELSGKNYQTLYDLKSLDFVLMFVPIEPAFILAVAHDRELFMDAYSKNVLLVSPSTFMFVIGTVAHLWRQEAQGRNAQAIADRGAQLYDHLCNFVEDLQKVGRQLELAQVSFTSASNRLSKNRGNVIRQAEMLKSLGVKPTNTLPQSLVADAMADEDEVVPAAAILVKGDGTGPSESKAEPQP